MSNRNRKNVTGILILLLTVITACFFAGCDKGGTLDETELKEKIGSLSDEIDEKALEEMKKKASDQEEKEESSKKPKKEEEEPEKSDPKSVLIKEAGCDEKDICYYLEDDFDKDGEKEAFAIIGQSSDEFWDIPTVEGTLWFSGKTGCKKLHENTGMGFAEKERIMTMGNTKYIMYDESYVTGVLTYVWYVSGGDVKEAPFSACGEVVTDIDGENRFRIMDNRYDCAYDPETDSFSGHTWKHYYFFFNEDEGNVCEYGGTTIDSVTAEYLSGRDLVNELIPTGYQIDSIFCRGNSLIVINFEVEEDGFINYYHYIYDFNKNCLIDDTGEETDNTALDGICLSALCPDIASYPEVPGPGGEVWYGE